jgi:hypothetical protein
MRETVSSKRCVHNLVPCHVTFSDLGHYGFLADRAVALTPLGGLQRRLAKPVDA